MKVETLAIVVAGLKSGKSMLYKQEETGLATRLLVVNGPLAQLGGALAFVGDAACSTVYLPGIDQRGVGLPTITLSSNLVSYLTPGEILATVIHENAHMENGDLEKFADVSADKVVDSLEAELAADRHVIEADLAEEGYTGLLKAVRWVLEALPDGIGETITAMSDAELLEKAADVPDMSPILARLEQFKQHF